MKPTFPRIGTPLSQAEKLRLATCRLMGHEIDENFGITQGEGTYCFDCNKYLVVRYNKDYAPREFECLIAPITKKILKSDPK